MKSKISNYPVATFNKLPKDIRDKVKKIQEKSGFIPNVFLALGHRPDELRAFFNYHDVIMERDSNLTKAEKEMIVVATSSANSCLYCVIAHGAILRVYEKNSFISEIIATNYSESNLLSLKQKKMLDYSILLCRNPEKVTQSDLNMLKKAGFSKNDIWDISSITSFFALSNRMASFLAIKPNDEFHQIGRLIKKRINRIIYSLTEIIKN